MEIKSNRWRLIVGLGNPGKKYEKTYHNVGILFIENKMPSHSEFQTPNSKHFGYSKIDDFILVKPKVFMNESGKAVKEAMKYFSAIDGKIKPEEILIVHDDSDIELGKYKLSFGRGSAGHRGVESIIKALGNNQFSRLRIGVRSNDSKKKAADLVLKKIRPADRKILEKTFKTINLIET